MKKIFFVFGYLGNNWGEWSSNTYLSLRGVLEIEEGKSSLILEQTKKELLSSIEKKVLEKDLVSGGSGDLGGSSSEFYGEFFTNEATKKDFVNKLNLKLDKIFEEVFSPRKK
jgi:hypothetical protein